MHAFAQKPKLSLPKASARPAMSDQRSRSQRTIPARAAQQINADTAAAKSDADFSRTPLHAPASRLQTRPVLDSPGGVHEQEADRIAEQVMRMPQPQLQSKTPADISGHAMTPAAPVQAKFTDAGAGGGAAPPIVHDVLRSPGQPLDTAARAFMEPRFGHDFSRVRIHTDARAAESAAAINARAYTVGRDIVFAPGRYEPASTAGGKLLAHELTHVVQQTGQPVAAKNGAPSVQRKLEIRPPGKGEASAFDRAQELVDRLNTVSAAIQYELKGRVLSCTVKDAAALTHFDNVMKGFIDRAELVPMRLLTSKGYVGSGTTFNPLFADMFTDAYVDLDDLLADDIFSFQSDLLHFLTERFHVKNYARRIGSWTTREFRAEFPKAHSAGKAAEAAQLQSLFNDPSVAFHYEERKPNNTWVNAFKSKAHGYLVFQVVHHVEREVAGGEMWVQKKDGKRVSMEDFRKERAAAPVP